MPTSSHHHAYFEEPTKSSEVVGKDLMELSKAVEDINLGSNAISTGQLGGPQQLDPGLPPTLVATPRFCATGPGKTPLNSFITYHNDIRSREKQPLLLTLKVAKLPCEQRDPAFLLQRLNNNFGTSRNIIYPGMKELLQRLLKTLPDFGMIYAHIRAIWPMSDDDQYNILELFEEREALNNDLHKKHIKVEEGDEVVTELRTITPRRLWDLFANRVVPYHLTIPRNSNRDLSTTNYWAVTHSWTEEMASYMSTASTAVNGKEWPVPVPKGVDIDNDVRHELLIMGAEYVWLDVVCLRQASTDKQQDEARDTEWRFDLPTIGLIYSPQRQVVRYLNGLGRPYEAKAWQTERHWQNRAWTLQETCLKTIDGCLPTGVTRIEDLRDVDIGRRVNQIRDVSRLREEDEFLRLRFLRTIQELRQRDATASVDKVTILSTMFSYETLPIYKPKEDSEQAWGRCIKHLHHSLVEVLLFGYSAPGTTIYWRPTWQDLMTKSPVALESPNNSARVGDYEDFDLPCTNPTKLELLKDGKLSFTGSTFCGTLVRNGQLKLWVNWMHEVPVEIMGDVVDEGDYIFLGSSSMMRWVMCKRVGEGALLEKVSMAKISWVDDKIPELGRWTWKLN